MPAVGGAVKRHHMDHSIESETLSGVRRGNVQRRVTVVLVGYGGVQRSGAPLFSFAGYLNYKEVKSRNGGPVFFIMLIQLAPLTGLLITERLIH